MAGEREPGAGFPARHTRRNTSSPMQRGVTRLRPAGVRSGPRAFRISRKRVALASLLATGLMVGPAWAYIAAQVTQVASGSMATPTISAHATPLTGMYPGATSRILVEITHTGHSPFAVTAVDLGPASVDGCGAENLEFSPPVTYPTIDATGTATVTVPVVMPTTAPNECQGVEFTVPVNVHGTAQ